jgi:hypothetical protein
MRGDDDDYLTFEGEILVRSAKAVQFLADFWEEPQWIPLSQSIVIPHVKLDEGGGERYTVQIKSWLCRRNKWSET